MKSLFPYSPRRGQISIMESIHKTIQDGNVMLLNAPTGLGKTICSLVPAIKSDMQILFITPRQSQHKIVAQSAGDIQKHLSVAQIIGKQSMCDNNNIKLASNFYDMCSLARKKGSKNPCILYEEGRCRYYEEIEKAKDANIITANYRHVFDPDISQAFFGLTQFDATEMILIIDEAHNLPQTLRDIASTRITNKTCERAQNELELLEKTSFRSDVNLAHTISEKIIMVAISFDDEKRRIDQSLFHIEDSELEWFERAGKKVIKVKEEDGTVAPVSYLLAIYKFFSLWRDIDDLTYVNIFERRNGNWSISIKCLEPAMLSMPIHNFHSTILMSGTLQPLDYFRSVLGLSKEKTILKSYPSIFPPENRILTIDNQLTTKYNERTDKMYEMYGRTINTICTNTKGNVAVFFPSYSLMKQVKSYLRPSRRIITETSGVKIDIHKELESRNNLLLGVMRGTLAEGVDYKNNLLSAVVIVGFPFPMQDIELKALTNYYDKKFGTGFVYASLFPSINVVLQAVGRGIRSETDKCTIHLLDKRFNNYKRWFT